MMERYDFDPDTHASRDTCETAMLSAGGVLTATEAVIEARLITRSRSSGRRAIMRCRIARWGSASSTTSPSRRIG